MQGEFDAVHGWGSSGKGARVMARKRCSCIYEREGHLQGQGDCPYGKATKPHPDGVLRRPLKPAKRNPRKVKGKSTTLKNMASVTIQKLPNGVVKITGRKMAGKGRKKR